MNYSLKTLNFFDKVYYVVRLIPKGRVTTYGAIATYLGAPKSSRMVGWAMNASHKLLDVPAHRVVNRKGILTGKFHFESVFAMQHLLEDEGVAIIDDKVVQFNMLFWDPNMELDTVLL